MRFVTFQRQDGHIGDFMLDVMSFASTHEYVGILDRTKRGRGQVKELGKFLGCGPVRYGYVFDKETRDRVADPTTAPIVRRIFDLIGNQNWSTIAVAKKFNQEGIPSPYMTRTNRRNVHTVTLWSPTRIGYIPKERTYLGETLEGRTVPILDSQGKPMKEGPVGRQRTVRKQVSSHEFTQAPKSQTEALVDRDLFDRANLMLTKKKTISKSDLTRNAKRARLLRGIIYCSNCRLQDDRPTPPRPGASSLGSTIGATRDTTKHRHEPR